MTHRQIGILHPGNMGISVAAAAIHGGFEVYWASEGRSVNTRERAAQQHLCDVQTPAKLCETCSCIISVCPPHAAEDVAGQVAQHGFDGLYLDANAISPQRALRIEQRITAAGAAFVDGGIIGGPAWKPGDTWLYLSGREAEAAAAIFSAGPLETDVIGEEVGKASALKMCFAANTKGTTALLCAIVAAAEQLGVREDLQRQWSRNGSEFSEQTLQRVRRVTAKAWRFAGEMEEIAATLAEAGLPGGFHAAAADVYRRIADFKDAPATPALEAVLEALLSGKPRTRNIDNDAVRIAEISPDEAPLDLLLEADPSPEKVRGYLHDSRCFTAAVDGHTVGVYVVAAIAADVYELLNIAVAPEHQQKGIGVRLLNHAVATVRAFGARRLEVGTGSFGYQLAFYQKAGFRVSAIDKDFFLKNYAEPIYEGGIQLKDMVRLAVEY